MTGSFYFYSFTLTLEVSVTSGNNKTNVLSDMHVLLSAAKNPTALNIRTNGQRS